MKLTNFARISFAKAPPLRYAAECATCVWQSRFGSRRAADRHAAAHHAAAGHEGRIIDGDGTPCEVEMGNPRYITCTNCRWKEEAPPGASLCHVCRVPRIAPLMRWGTPEREECIEEMQGVIELVLAKTDFSDQARGFVSHELCNTNRVVAMIVGLALEGEEWPAAEQL